LYHTKYTVFVALCLLPILLVILTTHTHANLQNNGSKIISSNNSHFKVSNLDIMTAGSNNSKSSDVELGTSNIDSSVKLNQASKNSDVFSFYNFELATPKNKANESELDKSNNEQFNGIYPADNNNIQNNDIHISSTPPSILEIESNQNLTNFFSTSNKTQLSADAGKDRTVYEGTSVTLNGSNSTSKDSIILSYAWRQIPNPNITIGSANTAIWSFVAPYVSTDTTLTFELTVTDNKGITSTDDVNFIVRDRNNIRNEINMSNQFAEGAEQSINSKLEPKQRNLVIQTLIDKNPVAKGEKQIIRIDLFDGNSDDKINDATIKGQIMDSSKKVIKKFSMNNNSLNVSLKIPKNAKVGNSVVSVNGSAPGYNSSNMDTNFRIQK
jgi:K319L-like, PKD domain